MSDNQAQPDGPEPDARQPESGEMLRRAFLGGICVAMGGWAAAIVGIPIIGFLVAPLFKHPQRLWRPVGAVSKFKIGDTVEVTYEDTSALPWAGLTGKTAAWLRRQSEQEFIAFSVNCAHLGCPVRWVATAQLFMCPCHGGVYYANGDVAAGPPPRPLARYPVRVHRDQVEILTSPAPIT
ncbi:MAG: ubiquinol-cytochrome c reductase iron-sulfur subunit [Terriglobia bacterium]